ncbi:MAG TPA: FHA domain-containing protein [Nitrospiria bacterium]
MDSSQELFLFILHGEPYAAAVQSDQVMRPVDLYSYFSTMVSMKQPLLSLYSTDPVFFKSLQVFSHKRPSTKATTELIDLERLLKELEEEKKELVLGLRQEEGVNLFYLRQGKLVETYYLFSEQISNEGSLVEQLLVYTYTAAAKKPLEVLVFRDVQVSPARDMAPAAAFLPLGVMDYFLVSKPELIVSSPIGVINSLQVEKGEVSIGRGPQNDLVIEDVGASREHGVILRQENYFIFKDLGSLNGTMLNGKPVSQERLKEGDRIQIGKHTLLFLEKRPSLTGEPKDSSLFEETTKLKIEIPPQDLEALKPRKRSLSLKILEGQDVGSVFEVQKDKVLIGRLNSDLVLSDPSVSRQHASIEQRENEFLFLDLKSRNGSFINGKRTESKILSADDSIKIGRTTLKVIIG